MTEPTALLSGPPWGPAGPDPYGPGAPSANGIEITDGTNTVDGATKLTVTGGTVGGTSPNATLDISGGGGGGAAIEPESGSSPIKISAFPAASLPMGPDDVVTGLQGGANVNFSQAQILTGQDGVGDYQGETLVIQAGRGGTSGGFGARVSLRGGYYGSSGGGGATFVYGGKNPGGIGASALHLYGASPNGGGGNAQLYGGGANYYAGANGGYVRILGGTASPIYGGTSGAVQFYGGEGSGPDVTAGDAVIGPGYTQGGATPGNLCIVNVISSPGSAVGTLTNAPAIGNPTVWMAVKINGALKYIPAW